MNEIKSDGQDWVGCRMEFQKWKETFSACPPDYRPQRLPCVTVLQLPADFLPLTLLNTIIVHLSKL